MQIMIFILNFYIILIIQYLIDDEFINIFQNISAWTSVI